jgi:hypothetical protein
MDRRMIDALGSLPGVSAVGLVDRVPLTTGDEPNTRVYRDEKTDLKPGEADATPVQLTISPGYLDAAGTRLEAGRAFDWHDDAQAPSVAVVNQTLARVLFGSTERALGGFFKQHDGTRTQVVGIVEDGKYENLNEDPQPALFLPATQSPTSDISIVVRSSHDPQSLAVAIRTKLRELDPGLPCFIQPWGRAMELALFPSRLAAEALGVLGFMAALLSLTGIFGLAAYTVSRRLKELGIRLALGADAGEVLRATLARPFQLLVWGSAAGLVLGVLASSVLAKVVYQATPRDPFVITGVVLVMLVLGLLATWIPARRALAADPLVLLREE